MCSLLLSFIIPTYNVSGTIKRCLDSIYALPFEEISFEVIVIDDCSKDNTVELVSAYANSNGNNGPILFRQEENHRQGAARNKGIAMAKGKYIVFVDGDDESAFGVIPAVRLAEENELDMVAMRYVKLASDGKTENEGRLTLNSSELFTGIEMQTEHPFWGTAPWAYVYRRSFIQRVGYRFAEDVLYEDCDFVNVHLYHAKKMAYCDTCGYRVHYNPNSTTHTLSYRHLSDYALLGTRMLSFYETLPDRTTIYANSVLEGGSFNIMKAFRQLPRLRSRSEVRAFYDRFDAQFDRKLLLGYREPAYCWSRWTRFGLKHRWLTIAITSVASLSLSIRAK